MFDTEIYDDVDDLIREESSRAENPESQRREDHTIDGVELPRGRRLSDGQSSLSPASSSEDESNVEAAAVRRSGRTHKPYHRLTKALLADIKNYRSIDHFAALAGATSLNTSPDISISLAVTALNKALSHEAIPNGWKEAMKSKDAHKWQKAAKDEFRSLMTNNTWTKVTLPTDRRALPARWVFVHKRDLNNAIIRWKARWVVRGDQQKDGIDYNDTFASVVKPMSYKTMFALAASLDLEIEQMDVKTAFLYGNLKEEIYVQQAEGFEDGTDLVYKLNRSLYGLKQSPRVWYQTLSDFLIQRGLHPVDADHSVFVNDSKDNPMMVAAYVDDLLQRHEIHQ